MKKNLLQCFSSGLAVVLFSAFAFAQQTRPTISPANSLYVVSAKAGGVNFVEGDVVMKRKNAKSGLLLQGDELEIGDKVSTGANGKAEILLNPGSFVRLAQNTTFEFSSTALEDLRLKLSSGSAMFEVITDDEFSFAVNTPKADFQIVKSGVYRVDVSSDGSGKIEVWKGRATANGAEIKSGKQATVSGIQVAVAKFDRDDKDALETWSKGRAKNLAKLNARLQNSAARLSLMSSYYRTRWSLYSSYGLWMFSRADNSFCFMPFGYGWSSPYGYYYPHDIWYYNLPPVIYNPPAPTTTTQTLSSAGASVRGGNIRPGAENTPARIVPPFIRVQNDIGQFPINNSGSDLFSPNISSPFRNPSSSSSLPPPSSDSGLTSPSTAPPRKGGN